MDQVKISGPSENKWTKIDQIGQNGTKVNLIGPNRYKKPIEDLLLYIPSPMKERSIFVILNYEEDKLLSLDLLKITLISLIILNCTHALTF